MRKGCPDIPGVFYHTKQIKIMNRAEKRVKNKLIAIFMTLMLVFTMIPASAAYAAASYDFQPFGADNTSNSLKMLEPSDIEFISNSGGYYLNQIKGEIDGTKDIKFTITMSAGMNNFSESGFKQNNMPLIKIYNDDESKVEAEYSGGAGDLKFLGSRLTNEINNHGSLKTDELYIGVDQGVLSSGEHVIVFGKNICGNNTSKILGQDIKFRFTVKTAPELSVMINEAVEFKDSVTVNDSGVTDTYPVSSAAALQTAIETARTEIERINDAADMTDEEKKKANDKASDTLYKALQVFKEARVVIIEDVSVDSLQGEVHVGDAGTATAKVTVSPDEDRYKRVNWSCSDNLMIDEASGAWQANFTGNAWIKATSKQDLSVSDTYEFDVTGEEGVTTVNLYDDEISLEDMLRIAGEADVSQIKSLKLFTSNDGTVTETDISYIRDKLTSLECLDMKNASVTELQNSAFSGKTTLKKIVFPDSLEIIGPRAFYNCSGLSDIKLPAGLTTIGSGAFAGCTSLPQELEIQAVYPPSYAVNGIFGSAFNGLSDDPATPVKAIKVPYSCKEDYKSKTGWRSFAAITETPRQELVVEMTTSASLAQVAAAALKKAGVSENQVTDLIIKSPKGVQLSRAEDINGYLQTHFLYTTTIDLSGTEFEDNKCNANHFKDRISLKYIYLPETTDNLGTNAFAGCKNLREFTIPSGVTHIGNGLLAGCTLLGDSVASNAVTPPDFDGTIFPDNITTVYVPAQSVNAYKDASGWSTYRANIRPKVSITLNKTSMSMEAPASQMLSAAVSEYGKASDNVTVFWESSNTSVATVSASTGRSVTVKGLKAGSATITACDVTGNVKATCTVTVRTMAAPTTVTASSAAYNKVKVSWSGVSGAQKYQVFRCNKSGSVIKSWTLGSTSRSLTDTGLTTGTAYYYKVRAYKTVNGVNYYGSYSSLKAGVPSLSKPATPSVSKASKTTVKVKWKGISGETGYQVYRATSKNGKYSKVKSVKMASSKYPYAKIKTKKGKTYYYKVRAYKKVGSKTVYSSFSSPKKYKLK